MCPVLGNGIIPAAGNVASELTAVVRRAFVPKMVYNHSVKSTPLLSALIANAQMASGGVSSITQPIQGSNFVNHGWSDYSGSFNQPSTLPAAGNAEFNLKLSVVPIPFLGMEGLVQMNHEVINLVESRMNDAELQIRDAFATALFNNSSNASQIVGLPAYVDDSTNVATYGNITRANSSSYWAARYVNNQVPITPTRAALAVYINTITKYVGEAPNMIVMGFGTWTKLQEDFMGIETIQRRPGDSSLDGQIGFRALEVSGVPCFPDPYCPEGVAYFLNTSYMGLHFHESAAYAFSGFQSTIPGGQIGYIGVVVTLVEFVGVKPKANMQVQGLTYENF
jgi:hypothetical protein